MILFSLTLASLLVSPPEDPISMEGELTVIDHLIQASDANLVKQKQIKEEILAYQKALQTYINNSGDKETVLKVAFKAEKLLNDINQAHLTETFSADFISELTVFSQIAQKKGIPKPL